MDPAPGRRGTPGGGTSPTAPSRATGEAAERFEEYVLPHLDVLYRVALSLTRNHADAADLVQDTLLRAFRAIGRFDGRHPRAWLLTVMRNAHLNRQRRERPELMADPDRTPDAFGSRPPRGGDGADVVVESSFEAVVESSLGELPAKLRGVVQLVDIDGLTYQEAALVLGVPVGTVMSRLHRARRRLRARLTAAGVTGETPS